MPFDLAEYESLATSNRALLRYHARAAVRTRFLQDVEDIVQKALLATWEKRHAISDSTRNYVVWTVRYTAKWWRTKYGESTLEGLPRVVRDDKPNPLDPPIVPSRMLDLDRIVSQLAPCFQNTYRELRARDLVVTDPSDHAYEGRVSRLKKAVIASRAA